MRFLTISVVMAGLVLMAMDESVDGAPSGSSNIDWERLKEMGVLSEEAKEKRPFCNAFTGCGQKRSSWPTRDAEFARAAALLRHLEGFDAMLDPNDLASFNNNEQTYYNLAN